MKIKLIGGEALVEGLNILLPELDAALCTRCADLTVTVTETEEDVLRVSLNGKEATLAYGGGKARAFRGFAKLIAWKKAGKTEASAEGFLGVEGTEADTLRRLLEPFSSGVFDGEITREEIQKADMYEKGLTGAPDSAEKRDSLALSLGLPKGMTPNALLSALNVLMTREEFLETT